MIVAIDGPAGAGKGTLAKILGQTYFLPVLDTGKLYRAITLIALRTHTDLQDASALSKLVPQLANADLRATDLASEPVSAATPMVAAHSAVRDALLEYQRAFAHQPGGAILDGRDIGTVVCPDADVKLFVTASLEERARRRWMELESLGQPTDRAELTKLIAARDKRDAERSQSPLRQAPDAHLLDTTALSIDEAAAAARRIIDAAVARP